MKFCRILADSQNHRRNTGNFTDTRLTAATKPLIIQRFLTLAKVALRLCLPAQQAFEVRQDALSPASRASSNNSDRKA
jgi:hypothetical protein